MDMPSGTRKADLVGAYDGWPSGARLMVEKAVGKHGGEDLWRSVHSIRMSFKL